MKTKSKETEVTDNNLLTSEATLTIKEFDDGSWRVAAEYDPPIEGFKFTEDYPTSYLFMGGMVQKVVLPSIREMASKTESTLDVKGSESIN